MPRGGHIAYQKGHQRGEGERSTKKKCIFSLVSIGNFLKLTAKSLETMFTLLEKQANLLLGRKVAREGSISVTIGKSIF